MANNKWDKVKGAIAAVAPGLATGIGGPLAGAAVTFITKALGLKDGDEDGAIAALSTSPDALLKLKLAEIEYQKFRDELGIKEEQVHASDRASARALAIARGQVPQISLSAVYTVGYFGMIFGIMMGYLEIPDRSSLFSGLIGIMTAAQTQIMNYFFGSSSGSAKKTEVLARG